MSEIKHTPGEWSIDHGRTIVGCRDDGKPQLVAAVFGIVEHGDIRDKDRAEANARLLIAAPDLLAALQLFVSASMGYTRDNGESGIGWQKGEGISANERLIAARAAIAKALGS